MLANGKAPKVWSADRKVRSRYVTFPRGAASKEARHKARKGCALQGVDSRERPALLRR